MKRHRIMINAGTERVNELHSVLIPMLFKKNFCIFFFRKGSEEKCFIHSIILLRDGNGVIFVIVMFMIMVVVSYLQ